MFACQSSEPFLPFQQSAVYAAAMVACGARVRWLDLGCGTALAVERGRLRVVFRGPIWDEGTLADRQKRSMRRLAHWAGVTVVTPEDPVVGFGLVPLITPLHHAIWTLRPDVRAGMAGKWRNRLAVAEAAGIAVQPTGGDTLDFLLAAEGTQRRARRYRALPEAFSRALPQDALRIWEWRQADEIAAAMTFIRHGTTATYHLGWASDAARGAGVHTLMLTRAAEALAAEGVRWLDLGSVDTEAAPGLARFKLGTGASLKGLGPTLLILP